MSIDVTSTMWVSVFSAAFVQRYTEPMTRDHLDAVTARAMSIADTAVDSYGRLHRARLRPFADQITRSIGGEGGRVP